MSPDILEIAEPGHRRKRVEAFAAQHEELFEALANGKADIALGLLTRMTLKASRRQRFVTAPSRSAMRRIGDLWPTNERAISHRAPSIEYLHRCLRTDCDRHSRRPPTEYQIAIGGVPGERSIRVAIPDGDDGALRPWIPSDQPGAEYAVERVGRSVLELNVKLVWVACTAPLRKAALENDRRGQASDCRIAGSRWPSVVRHWLATGARQAGMYTDLVDDRDGRIRKGSAAPGTQ